MPLHQIQDPNEAAQRSRQVNALSNTVSHFLPPGMDLLLNFISKAMFPETPEEIVENQANSIMADVAVPLELPTRIFHGTASQNVPSILEQGIQAVRDFGSKGFPGSEKRIAAFGSMGPNTSAGFSSSKTIKLNRETSFDNLREFLTNLLNTEGQQNFDDYIMDVAAADIPSLEDAVLVDDFLTDPSDVLDVADTFTKQGFSLDDEILQDLFRALSRRHPEANLKEVGFPVVFDIDPSVVSLPHDRDELFPHEKAVLFHEGIPPDFIRRAFITEPGMGSGVYGGRFPQTIGEGTYMDSSFYRNNHGQFPAAPFGSKPILLEELARILGLQ